MQLTTRELLTALHGMLFGGFFLMAIFGLVVELVRSRHTIAHTELTSSGHKLEAAFLVLMAAFGWLAVFTGTYIIYPWYRAKPPANTTDLTAYPRSLLLSHPNTAAWHNLGMEWKEHIAFFATIAITMLATILIRQRTALRQSSALRNSALAFALVALVTCGIAAGFGAMLDKAAPVIGGNILTIMRSSQ